MANNQYVNKVIFGDQTLIDLTSDTVIASNLKAGETAHDCTGALITGILQERAPSPSFTNGSFKIQFDYGIYGGTMTVPGIKIPVPSSGTNEFYLEFPNNAAPASNSDWTRITFSVDSNGNSNITDNTISASGVSF